MINQKKSKNQIVNLIIILVVCTSIFTTVFMLDLTNFSTKNSNSTASTTKNSLGLKLPKNTKIRVISTSYSTYKTGNAKTNAQKGNQATTVAKVQSETAQANNPNSDSKVPSTTSITSQSISSQALFSASSTPSTPSTPSINYTVSSPLIIINNAELAGNASSGAGTSSNP